MKLRPKLVVFDSVCEYRWRIEQKTFWGWKEYKENGLSLMFVSEKQAQEYIDNGSVKCGTKEQLSKEILHLESLVDRLTADEQIYFKRSLIRLKEIHTMLESKCTE